jgi:hypothetical protein
VQELKDEIFSAVLATDSGLLAKRSPQTYTSTYYTTSQGVYVARTTTYVIQATTAQKAFVSDTRTSSIVGISSLAAFPQSAYVAGTSTVLADISFKTTTTVKEAYVTPNVIVSGM